MRTSPRLLTRLGLFASAISFSLVPALTDTLAASASEPDPVDFVAAPGADALTAWRVCARSRRVA